MAGPKVKSNLGKYWWAAIALFLLIGGWTALPLLNRSSVDMGVDDIGPSTVAKTDLNALGDGLSPEDSAPGNVYGKGGGDVRKDNIAMIRSGSSSGMGDPAAAAKASAQPAQASANLAKQNLPTSNQSAKFDVPKSKGFEGPTKAAPAAPNTPAFRPTGGAGGGGGGGGGGRSGPLSGAGGGSEFFGKGAAQGPNIAAGNLKTGVGGAPPTPEQTRQALGKVDSAAKAANQGLREGAEEAAKSGGGKAFGESGGKGGVDSKDGAGGGGGMAQLNNAADTPANLKGSDGGAGTGGGSNFQPPQPKQTQPPKADPLQQFIDNLPMTILQMGMNSMLGPIFSGMGNMMASGMGMDPKNYQGGGAQPGMGQPGMAPH